MKTLLANANVPDYIWSLLEGLKVTAIEVGDSELTEQVDQITDGDLPPALQVVYLHPITGNMHVIELHPANVSGNPWYVLFYLVNKSDGSAKFDAQIAVTTPFTI